MRLSSAMSVVPISRLKVEENLVTYVDFMSE